MDYSKIIFAVSLITLALFYGFLASKLGWFPSEYVGRALNQADFLKESMEAFGSSDNINPQVYNRKGVKVVNSDKIQPGKTLIVSLWDWEDSGELNPGARLINWKGQILHEWRFDRNKLFPNSKSFKGQDPDKETIHGSYLFPNGDLLFNIERVGTARVDACGEIIWRLPEMTHHSISRADDGTFWIPAFPEEPRVGTELYPDGLPGFGGKPAQANLILHVASNGEILDKINVLDILYKNNLERYIPKVLGYGAPGSMKHRIDITHLNDVEPLSASMAAEYPLFEAGDLLVSLRDLNLVFVFDPNSMKIKWHASEPFNHQHDPDFIGDGWIGVYDNNRNPTKRGTMLGGSRIVALQPHTNTVEIRFPTEHSEPFYSFQMGKWQLLGNGNMLLTESLAGRIVEVTPDGRTVWEWVHEPVGESRVPDVAKGKRFDLSREEIASWPCSSVGSSRNSNQEGKKDKDK